MTVEIITHSAGQTERLGEIIGSLMRGGELIALEGELGAGKTCLVRGLARGMGVDPDQVSSPTFVIRHDYGGATWTALRLVHVDAYRLSGTDDLESIGWDELLDSRGTVIAVEWPQRIESALPSERWLVQLAHAGPQSRRIRIDGRDSTQHAMQQLRDLLQSSPWSASTSDARCPSCGKTVPTGAATAPFCSARCRMADLNRWFTGEYRVTRPIQSVDDDDQNLT